MPIEATGVWCSPIENLRDLLASLPAWQSWVRATGANVVAKAKARTYPIDLPPPEAGVDREYTLDEYQLLQPFAVVDTMDEAFQMRKYAESDFTVSGSLALCFEDRLPDSLLANLAAAKLAFMNRVSDVLLQMWQYAGTGGYINITYIGALAPVQLSQPNEVPTHGQRLYVYFKVDYGV